jgi:hypothetical protein
MIAYDFSYDFTYENHASHEFYALKHMKSQDFHELNLVKSHMKLKSHEII